eukprot:TRINITY_DN29316_c0_g2_i1.p1 TRINITY_DN29316_c0_g2~~TRINITY_DN29316_c0_g2_i1.p1  ORF type:complete len:369 (+),score=89.53 TRINITY_DN29316_c0_g2_i1:82-1188(+)
MAALDQTRPLQATKPLDVTVRGSLSGSGGYNDNKHPYLSSTFRVGSVKSQKVNYSLAQKVFHSGDVPQDVLVTKRQVQKSKQANVLGTDPRDWNQSVIADQKIQRDPKDLKKQLLQVRAGLLDEKSLKVPKNHDDDSIAELHRFIVNMTGKGPIGKCTNKWFNALDERGLASHCTRDDWPDWNTSTSTHTKDDAKQAASRYDEVDTRRQRMLKTDPKLDATAYVDPMSAVSNVNSRLRERKIDFQELKEAFKQELRVEFPTASEERLQAMAQRLLNEKLLSDEKMSRFPVQHESFKPNLSVTTQDRRYKEYHHPGVWQWSEAEKRHCWSCCLNYGESSRGCEYRVVNPDAWCTLGFERRPGVAIAGKA